MGSVFDEFRSAASEFFAATGEIITVAGVAYPCSTTSRTHGADLVLGGERPIRQFAVVISNTAPEPAIGTEVVFKGRKYTVESVEDDGALFTIACADRGRRQ